MPAPYISAVVVAREHDAHIQAFLDSWSAQSERCNLTSEIIVVSVAASQLTKPDNCAVRFVEAPPGAQVHQLKNAGIRRARGAFVLATNSDVIFSSELMRFFAERKLEQRRLYRVDLCESAGETSRLLAAEGTFQLGADGVQVLEHNDIVALESGIRLGSDWFPLDFDGSEAFRWVGAEAEILLDVSKASELGLILDLEPGPSAGGKPVVLQMVDPSDSVVASTMVTSRCTCRLRIPCDVRFSHVRLRIEGGNVPLAHDPRLLNLRIFGIRWDVTADAQALIRVRTIGRREVQLTLLSDAGSSLESLNVKLTDAAGNLVARMASEPLQSTQPGAYLLTLNVGGRGEANLKEQPESYWPLEVTNIRPATDWAASIHACSPFAGEMCNPAFLHTNGCSAFTLLSREDWFALRGYPEILNDPAQIGAMFCYSAHHAGIREVVLREPLRAYRVADANGSISDTVDMTWIDRMRKFDAPMIFNRSNWGLADVQLTEW